LRSISRQVRAAVRRAKARTPDPSEVAGELNIVPFLDVVVNLMLFLLATVTATMTVAQIEVDLPGICSRGSCTERASLDLAVTVTARGVVVASAEGVYAPGCTSSSSGALTVPRRGSAHDVDALRTCLEQIAHRHPSERGVTLSADPEVPYEELITVMDTLRGSVQTPLFADIRLSAGTR
jgi:biopolymer transport protein TolR